MALPTFLLVSVLVATYKPTEMHIKQRENRWTN